MERASAGCPAGAAPLPPISIHRRPFLFLPCAGRYAHDNCPAYLTREGFAKLKSGAVDKLHVVTDFFLPTLCKRQYSKVILMDHVDWLSLPQAQASPGLVWACLCLGGGMFLRPAPGGGWCRRVPTLSFCRCCSSAQACPRKPPENKKKEQVCCGQRSDGIPFPPSSLLPPACRRSPTPWASTWCPAARSSGARPRCRRPTRR